ncbi:MAG: shikimate kinase [Alphaproteobacteria bacterium]|nr:shikimate kinase [Alphaproteobacteria bacterium]
MNGNLTEPKIILLVGMMGVGKTSLGRILAKHLKLPFMDSDKEIEKITGFTISDLFARYGEEEFRKGEERIMERLLKGKPCVLSSGGGAFLSEKTREVSKKYAVSVWIKAGSDVISKRTQGRTHRPLVPAADNKKAIERLVSECYPLYEKADIMVESFQEHPYKTVNRLLTLLEERGIIENARPIFRLRKKHYKKETTKK